MSRPEVRIALFGFLAAFLWEMWQMPFYATAGLTIAEAVRGCSLGSLGDSGLMVLAYSVGSIATGNRHWVRQWTPAALAAYLGTGLLATIVEADAGAAEQVAVIVLGHERGESLPQL